MAWLLPSPLLLLISFLETKRKLLQTGGRDCFPLPPPSTFSLTLHFFSRHRPHLAVALHADYARKLALKMVPGKMRKKPQKKKNPPIPRKNEVCAVIGFRYFSAALNFPSCIICKPRIHCIANDLHCSRFTNRIKLCSIYPVHSLT